MDTSLTQYIYFRHFANDLHKILTIQTDPYFVYLFFNTIIIIPQRFKLSHQLNIFLLNHKPLPSIPLFIIKKHMVLLCDHSPVHVHAYMYVYMLHWTTYNTTSFNAVAVSSCYYNILLLLWRFLSLFPTTRLVHTIPYTVCICMSMPVHHRM